MTNAARFEQFLARLSAGDVDSIKEFIAHDYFDYAPPAGEPSASNTIHEIVSDLRKAMPDLSFSADNLRVEGGLLKGRITAKGTHTEDLWGAPGSGDAAEWTTEVTIRPIGERFAINIENVQIPVVLNVIRQFRLVNPPDRMDQPTPYPSSIPDPVLQFIFNGQAAEKPCSHFGMIKVTEPATDVCEQCVASGDIWPALRMCLTCGFVGCCDTSKNKHMKQHSEETGHVLVRSIRLTESWVFCYADNAFFPGRRLDRFRAEGV